MKEYDKIAQITNEYLYGRMYKLTMEFINPENLHVSVSYEDQNDDFIEYELEFHPSTREMDFLGHQCRKALYKLNLSREPRFEKEICNYLCNL